MNKIKEFFNKVSYVTLTYGELIVWFLFITFAFLLLVGGLQ